MNETELLQKIKDAEQQLADARRMLEDYRSKSPWKPKDGETYWFISTGIKDTTWAFDHIDEELYAIGNVFRTEDDAEREVRRRKTHQKLKELATKWNTEPIDFSNSEQVKWSLIYVAGDINKLQMGTGYVAQEPNTVYFTHDVLDQIKKEISEEELIEYCKGDY